MIKVVFKRDNMILVAEVQVALRIVELHVEISSSRNEEPSYNVVFNAFSGNIHLLKLQNHLDFHIDNNVI